jgi:hypothetical protein
VLVTCPRCSADRSFCSLCFGQGRVVDGVAAAYRLSGLAGAMDLGKPVMGERADGRGPGPPADGSQVATAEQVADYLLGKYRSD